jgi:hypothetical protein
MGLTPTLTQPPASVGGFLFDRAQLVQIPVGPEAPRFVDARTLRAPFPCPALLPNNDWSGATFGGVNKKKNKKKKAENPAAAPVEKALVVDEEYFTDAIRSLVNSPPAPLETIRRKNPETDPLYRPGFDLIPKVRMVKKRKNNH